MLRAMRIAVRHDNAGRWWWTLLAEDGRTLAVSSHHASRTDCVRAIAELKVEGPSARVDYEDGLMPPVAEHGRSPA
jgi:uncharacterized protein YegP (UPF0339 family)